MKIRKIRKVEKHLPTYDFLVNGVHNYLLDNGCVSHNTSLVIGTTAGIGPIYKKYFVETNSVGATVSVAPNLNKENFWFWKEQTNIEQAKVIEMVAVIQKWIDQSISMELFINPAKVSPKDIYNMYTLAHKKGLKTIYYTRSMSLETKEDCVSCSG